jgi:YD repeat-containing protein
VTYPGNTGNRTYEYGTPAYALVAISVNGVRYGTYSYGGDGRVASSGLVLGIERDSFTYGTNQTTVTNALGAKSTYTYTIDGAGRRLLQSISRSGVTNCPDAASSYTYDANGLLTSETDWNGNKTTYSYDATGRLLNKKTGINPNFPGQERLTTIEWLDADRIQRVRTYGSTTAQPLTETLYTYYGLTTAQKGRVASMTVYNRTVNGVSGQAQTTSYAYAMHGNGLVATMTVDGPLAGNADYVRYTYSAQGDMLSVANGLGHTTTFAGYNGLGLPGTITDANGLRRAGHGKSDRRVSGLSALLTGAERRSWQESNDEKAS